MKKSYSKNLQYKTYFTLFCSLHMSRCVHSWLCCLQEESAIVIDIKMKVKTLNGKVCLLTGAIHCITRETGATVGDQTPGEGQM